MQAIEFVEVMEGHIYLMGNRQRPLIGIGIFTLAFLVANFLSACTTDYSRDIFAIEFALAIYVSDHQRYPEDLDILIGESGVTREALRHFAYHPDKNYGTYRAEYNGDVLVPLADQYGREMLLYELVHGYYRNHGRFPRDLSDIFSEEFMVEIRGGKYQYHASSDLQGCTLEGKPFANVLLIRLVLHFHYRREGGYPTDLADILDSNAMFLRYVNEPYGGKAIRYEASKDGQTAHLEGKELKPILSPEPETESTGKVIR